MIELNFLIATRKGSKKVKIKIQENLENKLTRN